MNWCSWANPLGSVKYDDYPRVNTGRTSRYWMIGRTMAGTDRRRKTARSRIFLRVKHVRIEEMGMFAGVTKAKTTDEPVSVSRVLLWTSNWVVYLRK
ncbi:hypothetical protein RUM44_003548 [Polyplax serrata]|uniref:Uncharacterized protein n=1 Tax=Polyplax serrata TaxID=468196 RepID=A0ABR1AGT4_POLSC